MVFTAICVAILLSIQTVTPSDMKKSSDKYGPYTIAKAESEVCRGPKLIDQAVINAAFTKNDGDFIIGTFLFNVTVAVKMEELKITVYNMKNNKKNIMWNYKITEPCKHFAVAPTLIQKLHVKPENCVVNAGMYNFDVNITNAVQTFYGHSFFYGEYFFKLVGLSKKGNFGCMIMHQVFEKKV